MSFPINEINWFENLSNEVQLSILNVMNERRYLPGERIYTQASKGNTLYRIKKGAVRISVFSQDGKELIMGSMKEGSMFGEMGVIDNLPRLNSATAETSLTLQCLDGGQFLELRRIHTDITDQLLLATNYRLRLFHAWLEDLNFYTLSRRLAKRFYIMALNVSNQSDFGQIRLKITQEDLGRNLGVSRQSINRAMKDLVDNKLVVISRDCVEISSTLNLKKYVEGNWKG